jgi:hypothetical protein
MAQVLMIAIAIAVLLVGTFLFGRLFQTRTQLDRGWAIAIGFVLSLAIVIAIEAVYLAVGQW